MQPILLAFCKIIVAPNLEDGQTLKELVKKLEQSVIEKKLHENQGNKMKTAKELGISRRALIYKIEEYGIG